MYTVDQRFRLLDLMLMSGEPPRGFLRISSKLWTMTSAKSALDAYLRHCYINTENILRIPSKHTWQYTTKETVPVFLSRDKVPSVL